MLVESSLRRLVVIRRDNQLRVGADLFGMSGEIDRFLRRVGAGAGNHRDAARGAFDTQLRQSHVLLMAEGRRFTASATDDQTADSPRHLPVDQSPETLARRFLRGAGE